MANRQAPVLLTHISRATRMIALSTPELWAAIHIPVIAAVRADVEQVAQSQAIMTARARGVEEWLLRRSGDMPLRISVFERREYSGMTDIHELSSDIIIDILISCCSRWKDVDFSCRPTTISRVASLTRFDVPLLQSLSISSFTYSNSLDETYIWRQSDVLKSSMLKKLGLLGNIVQPVYPVNWSNLTHLYCDHATSDIIGALMDVLRQAVRLIGLDLHLFVTGPHASLSGTMISLPCLTTLVIAESHAIDFENVAILELINAPLLQAMSYNAKQDCPPRSPALISCLRRSSNIRELCISQPAAFLAVVVGTACVPIVEAPCVPIVEVACVPVEETTCVPEIVKIGLVVAAKFVSSAEANPGADTAISSAQFTSPPFPVPVHVTSNPPETAVPPIVVCIAPDALYTDAPSANVTTFPRLETSLRNIYGTTLLYSQVVVTGVLRRVVVWPPLASPTKLSTSVATYTVAPSV